MQYAFTTQLNTFKMCFDAKTFCMMNSPSTVEGLGNRPPTNVQLLKLFLSYEVTSDQILNLKSVEAIKMKLVAPMVEQIAITTMQFLLDLRRAVFIVNLTHFPKLWTTSLTPQRSTLLVC